MTTVPPVSPGNKGKLRRLGEENAAKARNGAKWAHSTPALRALTSRLSPRKTIGKKWETRESGLTRKGRRFYDFLIQVVDTEATTEPTTPRIAAE